MKTSRSVMSMTGYPSTPHSHRTILIQQAGTERKRRTTENVDKSGSKQQSPIRQLFSIQVSKHSSNISKSLSKSVVQQKYHKHLKTTQDEVEIPDPIIRASTRPYPPVLAYAVSTHHGLYRLINEDKVSVVLSNRCMFGLFDGYNGSMASQQLKDKLLNVLLKYPDKKSVEAILQDVFSQVQDQLIKLQIRDGDKSGSSAIVCLIQNHILYVANLGTSMALGSCSKNGKLIRLSNMHDCSNLSEYARIAAGGGRLYRTKITLKSSAHTFVEGPLRIHPHGLTVTRTLGNYEAKAQNRICNQNLVLATPEIKYMKTEELNWVMLCSQGLLEVVTQEDIDTICKQTKSEFLSNTEHMFAEKCVQRIMKLALKKKCAENATAIMIVLRKLQEDPEEQPQPQSQRQMPKKPSLRYIGRNPSVRQQP